MAVSFALDSSLELESVMPKKSVTTLAPLKIISIPLPIQSKIPLNQSIIGDITSFIYPHTLTSLGAIDS